jgi:hypothetical protein
MSFGSAKYLLNGEGVAVPAAAPSKQFIDEFNGTHIPLPT